MAPGRAATDSKDDVEGFRLSPYSPNKLLPVDHYMGLATPAESCGSVESNGSSRDSTEPIFEVRSVQILHDSRMVQSLSPGLELHETELTSAPEAGEGKMSGTLLQESTMKQTKQAKQFDLNHKRICALEPDSIPTSPSKKTKLVSSAAQVAQQKEEKDAPPPTQKGQKPEAAKKGKTSVESKDTKGSRGDTRPNSKRIQKAYEHAKKMKQVVSFPWDDDQESSDDGMPETKGKKYHCG